MKTISVSVILMLVLFLGACTSIGGLGRKPTPPLAGGFTLKVCVLRDTDFSEERVTRRFQQWNQELGKFNINAVVAGRIDVLPRTGFITLANGKSLKRIPLGRIGQPSCDRVVYFLGRNAGDVLYGLMGLEIPLPEIFGEVDSRTHSRMIVVGKTATIGHVIMGGAKKSFIHEGYHLLGCGHYSWKKCFKQIDRLKNLVANNPPGENFVPALTPEGRVCKNRTETDLSFLAGIPCPKLFEGPDN